MIVRRRAIPVTIGTSGSSPAAAHRFCSVLDAADQPCTASSARPLFRSAIKALRLSGGAGKKREAPSPRAPAKKHAGAGSGAEDSNNSTAVEADEKPDVSRNWDVQKVLSHPVLPCLPYVVISSTTYAWRLH